MKKNKSKKSLLDNASFIKFLRILGIFVSIIVIVFALLQLFNIFENGDYIFIPGLGILMIIQALENWNKNKDQARFSLGVGVFIFTVFILNTIIHLIRGI